MDKRLTTSVDEFEQVLADFFQSPSISALELGDIRHVQLLGHFKRKLSTQRLYVIEGSRRSAKIYVKIGRNIYGKTPEAFAAALARDFETNLFWYERLASSKEFGAIRPLYHAPAFHATITEEVPGRNLGELVRSKLRFSLPALIRKNLYDKLVRAGRLLLTIQSACDEPVAYDLNQLVEDVDLRMRDLVSRPSARFSATLRQAILDFYEKHMPVAKKQAVLTGYMHRDFTMSNLLVSGEKLIVHDFSKIDVGPRLFDLTRFYHHLGLLHYKPIYAPSAVFSLQQAFLQGYGYSGASTDLLFNFFLIRHYVTHYRGLLRDRNRSLKSRLYDGWVMKKHQDHLHQIVTRTYLP